MLPSSSTKVCQVLTHTWQSNNSYDVLLRPQRASDSAFDYNGKGFLIFMMNIYHIHRELVENQKQLMQE